MDTRNELKERVIKKIKENRDYKIIAKYLDIKIPRKYDEDEYFDIVDFVRDNILKLPDSSDIKIEIREVDFPVKITLRESYPEYGYSSYPAKDKIIKGKYELIKEDKDSTQYYTAYFQEILLYPDDKFAVVRRDSNCCYRYIVYCKNIKVFKEMIRKHNKNVDRFIQKLLNEDIEKAVDIMLDKLEKIVSLDKFMKTICEIDNSKTYLDEDYEEDINGIPQLMGKEFSITCYGRGKFILKLIHGISYFEGTNDYQYYRNYIANICGKTYRYYYENFTYSKWFDSGLETYNDIKEENKDNKIIFDIAKILLDIDDEYLDYHVL